MKSRFVNSFRHWRKHYYFVLANSYLLKVIKISKFKKKKKKKNIEYFYLQRYLDSIRDCTHPLNRLTFALNLISRLPMYRGTYINRLLEWRVTPRDKIFGCNMSKLRLRMRRPSATTEGNVGIRNDIRLDDIRGFLVSRNSLEFSSMVFSPPNSDFFGVIYAILSGIKM